MSGRVVFWIFSGFLLGDLNYLVADQTAVQNLLDLLPNLEHLKLMDNRLPKRSRPNLWQPFKWNIKLGKIAESSKKCAFKALEFDFCTSTMPDALQVFLGAQDGILKSLAGRQLPNGLKDLRLEYLDFHCDTDRYYPLNFLSHLVDLKSLRLDIREYSDAIFNMICELKNLESLELVGWVSDSSNWNNLYKLEKLKVLRISIIFKILDHLEHAAFQDLEELDASFCYASVESVRKMKRIAPNLKKLKIRHANSDTVNGLLEALENLEEVEIQISFSWEITD